MNAMRSLRRAVLTKKRKAYIIEIDRNQYLSALYVAANTSNRKDEK